MESLRIALNAVVPFFIYMAFGYLIRSSSFVSIDFMKKLNQMVFKAFYPIMMFYNLYHRDGKLVLEPKLVIVGVLSEFFLIFLLFLIVPRLVKENAKRGVLIQAVYRSNFVLFAAPLTESVFGAKGLSLATMMIAIIIPIYNVMAIIVLEYYRGGKISGLSLIKKVLSNPLIAGALFGLLFVVLGIELPACVEKPVSQFSSMTTPLALFILGGTLQFASLKKHLKYIIPSMSAKLIFFPALMLCLASLVHLAPMERFVFFTMYATPVAAASFPMAASMGGDGDLAGELVAVSTTLSVITIFLWVFFLNSYGML